MSILLNLTVLPLLAFAAVMLMYIQIGFIGCTSIALWRSIEKIKNLLFVLLYLFFWGVSVGLAYLLMKLTMYVGSLADGKLWGYLGACIIFLFTTWKIIPEFIRVAKIQTEITHHKNERLRFFSLKKILIAVFFLFFLIAIKNHIYLNVDTFDKYCNYIEHSDDFTLIVNFQEEKIKEDFVLFYNKVLIANIARDYLGGVSPNDSIVAHLYKEGMIGVFQKGNNLYIKHPFLLMEKDSIRGLKVPNDATLDGFKSKFEYLLKSRFDTHEKMDNIQKGIFCAVGAFYEQVVIQGDFKGDVIRTIDIKSFNEK